MFCWFWRVHDFFFFFFLFAEPHDDGTVSFQIRGKPDATFKAAALIQENLPAPVTFSALEMNLGRPQDVALLIGPADSSVKNIMKTCDVKIVTRPKEERSDLVVIEGLPDNVQRAYDLSVEAVEKAKKEKDSADAYRR